MRSAQLRLGLRLARRELRRRPARAALVLLMVFIPTCAMAAVTTLLRTSEWSAADQRQAGSGQADAAAHRIPEDPTELSHGPGGDAITDADVDRLRNGLGPGSAVLVERTTYDRVRQGDRRTYLAVDDLNLADPMVEGRFGHLSGRYPTAPGETVLTLDAARELKLGIGDRFISERLGHPLLVVGLVRALEFNRLTAYVRGTVLPEAATFSTVWVRHAADPLPHIPGWEVTRLTDESFGTTKTEGVFWSYVGGGVGLLVLGTVVTAAFAIGARRQLRSVGLLSASGAAPRTVAWFLVAQGVVAGAVGSVVGVAGGVVITRLLPDRALVSLAGRPVDGPVTRPADLLPVLLIGTVAAAIAAWFPARSVARVPTLQALAGRRPLSKVPRMLPLLGACAVALGCALFAMAASASRSQRASSLWAVVAVGGAVAVLVGTLAVAPWTVAGLERACTRWSQSWRLAGRSLARSRVRSSAVVGAVCAVAATVVGGSTIYESLVVRHDDRCCGPDLPYLREGETLLTTEAARPTGADYVFEPAPVPASVLARIHRIVPAAQPVELSHLVFSAGTASARVYVGQRPEDQPGLPSGSFGAPIDQFGPALATPALLDLFQVPAELRDALGRDEAISVGGRNSGGELQLFGSVPDTSTTIGPVPVRLGGAFHSPAAATALPTVLMGAPLAARLGLVSQPAGQTVLVLPGEATARQRRALELLSQDLTWETTYPSLTAGPRAVQVNLSTGFRDRSVSEGLVRAIILAVSLLLILAVVAVGLALAAKDSEDERQVLAATGAPPRVLRQVGTRRAVLLVVTSALIALPAGLLPAGAIVAAVADRSEAFRVDPWSLGFVMAGVPLAVAAVTAAGGRVRDGLRSGRPEVFGFAE